MATIAAADTLFAADRAAWRAWLEAHHAMATVVWLLLHKKHVDESSVTYDEAVEEALCWGWIDGLTNRWDERSYAVRFTPRKPGRRAKQRGAAAPRPRAAAAPCRPAP